MGHDPPRRWRAKASEETSAQGSVRRLRTWMRDAWRVPDFKIRQAVPRSWTRRITDERKLRVTAVQRQLQRDLADAATQYLADSKREAHEGQRARDALMLAMTGRVLKRAGKESLAIQCFAGAARQFGAHAHDSVATSPRDALWALERAEVFSALGRVAAEIEDVRAKYKVLNAALHSDEASPAPESSTPPLTPASPPTGGAPPRGKGVPIFRDYVARLERLLDGL